MTNRIREIRESMGLSKAALGRRVGTSGVQIGRLEIGDPEKGGRKLTVEWMRPIAEALGVKPADLLAEAVIAELCDDVAAETPIELAAIAGALKARRMGFYRVLTDAVADAGIVSRSIIVADHTESAIEAAKTGDIVIADARRTTTEERALILRVLVRPDMLVTNRPQSNVAMKLHDESIDARITAVIVQDADLPNH